MTESPRRRAYDWGDPMPSARKALELDGLSYFQQLLAGAFPAPPIAQTIDMVLTEVEDGRAVFELTPQEFHYNPIGSVHGGIAATLLDSAMGCAIHSQLPSGVGYTTIELSINYLRPITIETGRIRCEGKVIHVGRRLATAEGRITDSTGRLLAHGTTTCMVFTP
ncbi:MAG: PaaI family thioesterase [Chloroflexi bacterium]|nr:MAG: PaaI family thioesterase [Chloroflexota bacterium]